MGQRSNYAALKDVRTLLRKEECALGMGQREQRRNANMMDAQTKPSKEECARGTGQKEIDAAAKDAQIKSSKEECALGMGQRRGTNDSDR